MSTQVHPTVVCDPHQVLALSKEIQNLLEKGAKEPVNPCVHSKYFLVQEKDGSFWPILDLRHLNKSLKCLPFYIDCRCSTFNQTQNVVHFSGLEGCIFFTSPSPHITEGSFGSLFKAELSSSESFRLACLFLPGCSHASFKWHWSHFNEKAC